MLGQEITMLMPDYLRHVHKSAIARYTQTARKHINWTRFQLPGLHKDRHEIPIELSIARAYGHPLHAFTAATFGLNSFPANWSTGRPPQSAAMESNCRVGFTAGLLENLRMTMNRSPENS